PAIYRSGGLDDLDYQAALLSAYNDWVMTWAIEQPGRFIPLGNLPYWDIERSVQEIQRCAAIGMKGLIMSGVPQRHGCPILADPVWKPVWAAAQDADLCISFHIGASGRDAYKAHAMGTGALQVWSTVTAFLTNAQSALELMVSGVLHRNPRLRFAIVESGMGWVPFTLEAAGHHYQRYQPRKPRPEMRADEPPSYVFRRQVFVNTWFEQMDDKPRSTLPIDNIMFETDYPHPTCLIGDEITDAIDSKLSSLTPDELDKVLHRNAMRCFSLSPEDIGLDAAAA